jgi:hypothetical protein
MEPESMDRTSDLLAVVGRHGRAVARPMLDFLPA